MYVPCACTGPEVVYPVGQVGSVKEGLDGRGSAEEVVAVLMLEEELVELVFLV